MGKKKKPKRHDVVCFCVARPDLDAILSREIGEGRVAANLFGMLSDDHVYDLEEMLDLEVDGGTIHWQKGAPPIEVIEERDKVAKLHIGIARDDLREIVESQPYAWFSRSPSPVDELEDRLSRARSLVRLRWPDVETKPVKQAAFWISRALAFAIRHETAGVIMLRDGTFVAKGGELIQRRAA